MLFSPTMPDQPPLIPGQTLAGGTMDSDFVQPHLEGKFIATENYWYTRRSMPERFQRMNASHNMNHGNRHPSHTRNQQSRPYAPRGFRRNQNYGQAPPLMHAQRMQQHHFSSGPPPSGPPPQGAQLNPFMKKQRAGNSYPPPLLNAAPPRPSFQRPSVVLVLD